MLTKVKKIPYERFTESFSPLVLKVCVFSADIRPFCKPYRYPAAVFEYLAEIYKNSGLSGRISDQPNNWYILGYRTSLIFFLLFFVAVPPLLNQLGRRRCLVGGLLTAASCLFMSGAASGVYHHQVQLLVAKKERNAQYIMFCRWTLYSHFPFIDGYTNVGERKKIYVPEFIVVFSQILNLYAVLRIRICPVSN